MSIRAICVVPAGLDQLLVCYPALPCRAILCRPFGAEVRQVTKRAGGHCHAGPVAMHLIAGRTDGNARSPLGLKPSVGMTSRYP